MSVALSTLIPESKGQRLKLRQSRVQGFRVFNIGAFIMIRIGFRVKMYSQPQIPDPNP